MVLSGCSLVMEVFQQIVDDRRIRHGKIDDFREYAVFCLDLVKRGEDLIDTR